MKRVFLIVLDSFGVGEMPDAADFGDKGSNTLAAVSRGKGFAMPNMAKLGLFSIDGVTVGPAVENPEGVFGRCAEASKGKDTTTGHWEISGIVSKKPMPTFPDGFPEELLNKLSEATGRGILCNRPYSGTAVIQDYGEEHVKTGDLIVYTSADSVLQIAAHESVVPVETLYEYCRMARKICQGPWAVGRVIARPFEGEPGHFTRTSRRHDFSLEPPENTMLDWIREDGKTVLAVGKIRDIFAGRGISEFVFTGGNQEGIEKTLTYMDRDFEGLCFTNLVDFDMLYGHRNDVDGYAAALTYFDSRLPELLAKLREEDLLLITADHGCDPSTKSTDHSREYIPIVMAGAPLKAGVNLGTRSTFADIGATVLDYLHVPGETAGVSFYQQIQKN
ncbi:phosphopentomutase [Cuneatibacter sp. NSJ-177]|uniref:phosphopentomutase n=1 Tax=Cuneatibacter sp. NSJ-177 TaxID=2931401 RepID=UPI001FD1406F|nr:phosphopentomutase [Cuneatibacter sp. NSJ-177]MCJ7835805.1 phosphopentomutase [Cuneatibacter sp. NSJ-177]